MTVPGKARSLSRPAIPASPSSSSPLLFTSRGATLKEVGTPGSKKSAREAPGTQKVQLFSVRLGVSRHFVGAPLRRYFPPGFHSQERHVPRITQKGKGRRSERECYRRICTCIALFVFFPQRSGSDCALSIVERTRRHGIRNTC